MQKYLLTCLLFRGALKWVDISSVIDFATDTDYSFPGPVLASISRININNLFFKKDSEKYSIS